MTALRVVLAIAGLLVCACGEQCRDATRVYTGDVATDFVGEWKCCGIDSCWRTTVFADGGAVDQFPEGEQRTAWRATSDGGFFGIPPATEPFTITTRWVEVGSRRCFALACQ